MYETNPYFYGTGRRKESVARVRLYAGTGKITINDRDMTITLVLKHLSLLFVSHSLLQKQAKSLTLYAE